jgi:hypothetical protein
MPGNPVNTGEKWAKNSSGKSNLRKRTNEEELLKSTIRINN